MDRGPEGPRATDAQALRGKGSAQDAVAARPPSVTLISFVPAKVYDEIRMFMTFLIIFFHSYESEKENRCYVSQTDFSDQKKEKCLHGIDVVVLILHLFRW